LKNQIEKHAPVGRSQDTERRGGSPVKKEKKERATKDLCCAEAKLETGEGRVGRKEYLLRLPNWRRRKLCIKEDPSAEHSGEMDSGGHVARHTR